MESRAASRVAIALMGAAVVCALVFAGARHLEGRKLVIAGLSGLASSSGDGEVGPPTLTQDFTISLPDGLDDRYLRAQLVIVFHSTEDRDLVAKSVGQLREAFISSAVDVVPDDYLGTEGIERGRRMMTRAMHKAHPDIHVRDIYVAEFVLR